MHVPAEDKIENYNTNKGKVRKWANKVIAKLIEPATSLPILIHCTSGKDRTGVITAIILKAFKISDEIIIKEYLMSEGVADASHIKQALLGIGDVEVYLKGNYIHLLNEKFRNQY